MAAPYVSQGPFVTPAPGNLIPTPNQVPGKEYSHNWDWDATHTYDTMQNLAWDGAGGVADALDYTDIYGGELGEVDAIAQTSDALFHSVVNNTSTLLFSVSNQADIIMEHNIIGPIGPWAGPSEIDRGTDPEWPDTPFDVDGLDLWGTEPQSGFDADMFSVEGDPYGVSVYKFNQTTGMSDPAVYKFEIADALGISEQSLINQIDVDAIMINATMSDGFPVQKEILFSLAPIPGLYDGGEIWYWDGNLLPGSAQYLNHGGHLWDTAFDVMGTFNLMDENINALEAVSFSVVPEPVSATLFIVGGATLGFRRFRKKFEK